MKNLCVLFFSLLVFSGCEDLSFKDEDVGKEVKKKEKLKVEEKQTEETVEEPDNLQREVETPLIENKKEISINIEERETLDNTVSPEISLLPEEVIIENPEREIKVSVVDNSTEENGQVVNPGFNGGSEKVTEWTISRRERETQVVESPPPDETQIVEEKEPEIPEEETTVVSEDLELTEDTVIEDRKVVLNMVTVKTFEYDLSIIAEMFIANHSVIQNFSEGIKAKKEKNGRSGGNILIEAERAEGELQLVLNGESAGQVPNQRRLSKEERAILKGVSGVRGMDAIYRTNCRSAYMPILLIPLSRHCWEECAVLPTKGQSGGKGLEGFMGHWGKDGGNSGSFHLKAFELSEFHLTNIQNNPGPGSKGSRGSPGGQGGKKGKNGIDSKGLCDVKLSQPDRGKKGKQGPRGRDGRHGKKGKVCLERILTDEELEQKKNIKPKTEVETICKRKEGGISCREVLVEKKENVICY